jgi:hypothetical protein
MSTAAATAAATAAIAASSSSSSTGGGIEVQNPALAILVLVVMTIIGSMVGWWKLEGVLGALIGLMGGLAGFQCFLLIYAIWGG